MMPRYDLVPVPRTLADPGVSSPVTRAIGASVSHLDAALLTSGLTGNAEVRRLWTSPAAADRYAGAANQAVQTRVRAQQEQKLGWFERTFYVAPEKQAKNGRRAMFAGALAEVAARIATAAADQALARSEAEQAAWAVLQIVGYAATAPDGSLCPANAALLSRLLDSFDLSKSARARITSGFLPHSVAGLPALTPSNEQIVALANLLFHAHAHHAGEKSKGAEVVPILIRVGCSQREGRDLVSLARANFQDERVPLREHFEVLRASVTAVGTELRLDPKRILAASRQIASYNPYEVQRRRHRGSALTGGMIGAAVLGVPLAPALSATTSLAGHVFGAAAGSTAAAEIRQAFLHFGHSNGLPVPDVSRWATGQP